MTVITIGADDVIVFPECRNGAYAGRFLAYVEVKEPADKSPGIVFAAGKLKLSDEEHLPEQFEVVALNCYITFVEPSGTARAVLTGFR